MKLDATDIIFSKCVRLAANCCEAHGEPRQDKGAWLTTCTDQLQCCHIHTRTHNYIKHDPLNAVSMCAGHHQWYTAHPLFWKDFVLELRGQEHIDLLNEKLNYNGFKWLKGMKADMRKHYRAEHNRMFELRSNGATGKLAFVGFL